MRDLDQKRGAPRIADEEIPEPAPLRRLRLLVNVLMAVLILGFLAVSAMLVIRLADLGSSPSTGLAGTLAGADRLVGVGRAGGHVVVVLEEADGARRLLAFDAPTGAALPLDALPEAMDWEERLNDPGSASGGGNDPPR